MLECVCVCEIKNTILPVILICSMAKSIYACCCCCCCFVVFLQLSLSWRLGKQEISVVIFHAITMIFSFFSYFRCYLACACFFFLFDFYCFSYFCYVSVFVCCFLLANREHVSHVNMSVHVRAYACECVSYFLHLHLLRNNIDIILRRNLPNEEDNFELNKIKLKTN